MYIPIVMEMFTEEQATDGRIGKMENGQIQGRVRTGPLQIPREGLPPAIGPQIRIKTGGIVQIATGIQRRKLIPGTGRAIPGIITGQDPRQIKLPADQRPLALPTVKRIITT